MTSIYYIYDTLSLLDTNINLNVIFSRSNIDSNSTFIYVAVTGYVTMVANPISLSTMFNKYSLNIQILIKLEKFYIKKWCISTTNIYIIHVQLFLQHNFHDFYLHYKIILLNNILHEKYRNISSFFLTLIFFFSLSMPFNKLTGH